MALTPRLLELLEMCREQVPDDDYDCSIGWFDDDLTFHLDPDYPGERLFVWEWVHHSQIVRCAESKGIQIPKDPPIDLSKTF